MSDDRRSARRATSYNNGVVFSDRPLRANEVFTIQIDETETGWEGHLRAGLTSFDPNNAAAVPEYALPNLRRAAHCSMTIIRQTTELDTKPAEIELLDEDAPSTSYARAPSSPRDALRRNLTFDSFDANRLPTDVGTRISIFFTIDRSRQPSTLKVHTLINGRSIVRNDEPYEELFGMAQQNDDAAARYVEQTLPMSALPLYAVVDIYGNTKQVHIVREFDEPRTLQELCRNVIRARCPTDRQILNLPCPVRMKYFLRRDERSPMHPLEILTMTHLFHQ